METTDALRAIDWVDLRGLDQFIEAMVELWNQIIVTRPQIQLAAEAWSGPLIA